MFRKKKKVVGENILDNIEWVSNGDKINKVEQDAISRYGKTLCLDIGTGKDDSDGFTTIDIDPGVGADYVGDIRTLFASSDYYRNNITSSLGELKGKKFSFVRLKHVIEHIEWIYMPTLFDWVSSIVHPGGIVVIDTPNLEYITRIYLMQLEKQRDGKSIKIPDGEHPDIGSDELESLQRWVNFKFFSGCSPGDYHHTCLDSFLLATYLSNYNFEDIIMYNGSSLRAVAYRAETKPSANLEDMIQDILQ